MSDFDLDSFFAQRGIQTLQGESPEVVPEQGKLLETALKKREQLSQAVAVRQHNLTQTVATQVGLNPDNLPGQAVNIAGTTANDLMKVLSGGALNIDARVPRNADGSVQSSPQRRLVADGLITGLKGAIGVPEAAVGIGSLVSGGQVGKAVEESGVRFKEAKEILDTLLTPEQKAANAQVQGADGFVDTLSALGDRPSVIAHTVAESIPAMLAGGVVGRGAAAIPGSSTAVGAAVGEGTIMAGSQAENIRTQTEDGLLTPTQQGLAAVTGVMGGAVGMTGAKLAQLLRVSDVDEAIVKGAAGQVQRGVVPRVLGGTSIEALEETVQSAGEKVAENIALDRDPMQGVGNAAALGLVAGGTTGGAMNILARPAKKEPAEEAEARVQRQDLVNKGKETGDVTALLDPEQRHYSPSLAVNVLQKYSAAEQRTPEERQAASQQADHIVESLQTRVDKARSLQQTFTPEGIEETKSVLAMAQEELAATPETDTAAIAELQAEIQDYEKSLEMAQDKDLVKRERESLQKLETEAAKAKVTRDLWKASQVEDTSAPAVTEVAPSAETAVEPTQAPVASSEAAPTSAREVLTLAMRDHEAVAPDVLAKAATDASLTAPQQQFLRRLSEQRVKENQLKGRKGVRADIFEGNAEQGYLGLKDYRRNVAQAIKTGDTGAARRELRRLQTFAQGHGNKAALAKRLYAQVAGTNQVIPMLPLGEGQWEAGKRAYSQDEIRSLGGLNIRASSQNVVNGMQEEAAAIQETYQLLRESLTLDSSPAAVQEPVQTPVKPVEESAETIVPEPVTQQSETVSEEQSTETVINAIDPNTDIGQETGVTDQAESAALSDEVQSVEPEMPLDTVSTAPSPDASENVKVSQSSVLPAEVSVEFPNLIRKSFTQEGGNPATGTQRPLVKVPDFLTQWLTDKVDVLEFLDQDSLTGEQQGLADNFIITAHRWINTVQAIFNKTPDPKFYYKDFSQFLMDEDGQVAENVRTAIAAAVYSWTADAVNGGLANKDAAINAIIGRKKDLPVTPATRKEFIYTGTRQPTVINEIGAHVVQTLGWKLSKDAPKNHKSRLETALGTIAVELMVTEGLVERHTLMGSVFEVYHEKTPAEEKMSKADYAKVVAQRAKSKHHFIRIKAHMDGKKRVADAAPEAIARSTKGTSGFLDKLFAIQGAGVAPSFKPLDFKQVQANNSNKAVSSKATEALDKEAKAPYMVDPDMWHVLRHFDEQEVFAMVGVRSEDPASLHKANRLGVQAKNEGLRREWSRLRDFIDEMEGRFKTNTQPFFIQPEAWKNDRAGYSSTINPQTSKIHRAVVTKKSARTTIRWTEDDETNLNVVKLRIAEGLGVDTGKQSNQASLGEYKAKMGMPVFQDAVAALQKRLMDEDLTPAEKQAILDGVKAGGENLHSLTALVTQAAYKNGEKNRKFDTSLTAEIDGVTNGPMLGHILFGAFGSMSEAFDRLTKGGFFPLGHTFKTYGQWRGTPGNSDLYEGEAINLIKDIQGRLFEQGEKSPLSAALTALESIVGRLDNDGSPTSAGRKAMKPPVTKTGYGEGIDNTIGAMAGELIQTIYDQIEEINAKGSLDKLKPLLENINTLLAFSEPGNKKILLDTNMGIAAAMEMTFSDFQEQVLSSAYRRSLGDSVKAVMKEDFATFSNRRSVFNKSAGLAYELYNIVYQAKRKALIEDLAKQGKLAVNGYGMPIDDLSQEQEDSLNASLAEMAPVFHTALSKASGQREAAFVLPKSKKVTSTEISYRSEVKFKPLGAQKPFSLQVGGTSRITSSPEVSGAVGSVHSTDAAISISSGAEVDSVNVHDARIFGVSLAHQGARSLNRQTFEQLLAYSPMDEVLETLERSIKGLLEAIQQDPQSEQLQAEVKQYLQQETNKLYKKEKAAVAKAGGLIQHRLQTLRVSARAAASAKFGILASLQTVDQYAFEGGAYSVTEADRQRAKDMREARAARQDDKQALLAAAALDRLLFQPIKAQPVPVVASSIETVLQDQDDVIEPEGQEGETPEVSTALVKGDTHIGRLGMPKFGHDRELVQFLENTPNLTVGQLIPFLKKRLAAHKGQRTPDFYRATLVAVERAVVLSMPIHYYTAKNAPREAIKGITGTEFGWFHVDADGQASINIKGPDFENSSVTTELLMHELIHGAVAQVVEQEQQRLKADPAYTSEALELVQDLDRLLANARKKVGEMPAEKQTQFAEAVGSLQEFLTWGMTNLDFQKEVLNQPYQPTSLRKSNTLILMAQAFIDTVAKILFRGSSKTVGEMKTNGLAMLLNHTSGLLKEAQLQQQARQQQAPAATDEMTLAQRPPVQVPDVMNFSLEQIYSSLALLQSTPTDPALDNHLRRVLASVVENLDGPFGAFKAKMADAKAVSEQSVYLKALATGQLPYSQSARVAGLQLNEQQSFVFDMLAAVMHESLQDSSSFGYKEMGKLFQEARSRIQPHDLDSDPVKGQQIWNQVFAGQASGIDRLAQFAALGLTHPVIARSLGFDTEMQIEQSPKTLFGKLQKLILSLLNGLNLRLRGVYQGQRADAKLERLVGNLVDIQARQQRKLADHHRWDLLGKADELTAGLSNKVKGQLDDFGKSNLFRKTSNGFVKAAGVTLSAVAGDRADQILDTIGQMRDKLFEGKQGLGMSMLEELRGTRDSNVISRILLLATKQLEKVRKEIKTDISRLALTGFVNEGKDLTQADKDALAKALLRTGLGDILGDQPGQYSLAQLSGLLTDKVALQREIASLEGKLTGSFADYYKNQSVLLAYKMATGIVRPGLLAHNAEAIARLIGSPHTGKVSDSVAATNQPIIDTLVSLRALDYTNWGERVRVKEVLDKELARTDKGNGVEAILKLHKQLIEDAKDRLFQGQTLLMQKGYLPEVFNPHIEITVADPDVEGAELVTSGWEDLGPLLPDPADPQPSGMHLYRIKDRGLQPRLTGIMGYTGMRAKGSAKHNGLTSPEAPGVVMKRVKLNRQILARKQREIRETFSARPGYDPAKDPVRAMAPTYNSRGEIASWRYLMSEEQKDRLLERDNSFDMLLGTLASSTFDKESTREQNRKAVQALKDQWIGDEENPTGYLVFGPDSTDPEIQEMYRLLPEDTRYAIQEVWGDTHMMVRRDMLDVFFGYRKYSLSEMFETPAEERNARQQAFVFFVEQLLKMMGQHPGRAGLRVRQSEAVWQEVVKEAKDILVVKTGLTLAGNFLSNASQLFWYGVPVLEGLKHHKVAFVGALDWQRESTELRQLQAMRNGGFNVGVVSDIDERIRELEESLARNPVRPLIEAGLMPTIVEDVEADLDPYSYKSWLANKVDGVTGWVPAPVKTVARYAYMAHDTPLYKVMSQGTMLSDFMARYSLYQHMTTRSRDPMTHEAAVQLASDAFINYDIPTHKALQYANDMGIVYFTKYYMRIQAMIMHLMRDNPARAMLLLGFDQYLQGAQTVLDSAALAQFGNPLDIGAFKFLEAIDELATVKALASPFN